MKNHNNKIRYTIDSIARKKNMGGIVAFQWEKKQLILLQNRDNLEDRAIKAAAWDEDNNILGARCELKGGTWFGVSKNGRVAFLVDPNLTYNAPSGNDVGADSLTIRFLKSKLSPEKFAKEVKLNGEVEPWVGKGYRMAVDEDYPDTTGWEYDLIVADITSSSMFHICKSSLCSPHVDIQEVAFGVHTLSRSGLNDADDPKDVRLKVLFSEMIGAYKNKQLPPMKELAERFMYDPVQAVHRNDMSALFLPFVGDPKNKRYGTTSTTAFAVKPTKDVLFYERHFERGGGWTHHDFTFKIAP